MKKQITSVDIEALALGAGILGSGGGGNPYYDSLIARRLLECYGPVTLLSLDELSDNDFVLPVCFMGAPLIGIERFATGREFFDIVKSFESFTGKKVTALLSGEIGGANAFTGIAAAARLGLPLVDADLLGRAFPELHMSSATVFGLSASPVVMSDGNGSTVIISTPSNKQIEECARSVVVALGSSAAMGFYSMSGKQAQTMTIPGTVSYAYMLGAAILKARQTQQDPLVMVTQIGGGRVIASGVITDIQQEIQKGFLIGTMTISSIEGDWVVDYQNENLRVTCGGRVVVLTPDIIIPMDVQTATPITSESLRYGLRVALVTFPAPDLWKTEAGLALVGPRSFGYDCDYQPSKGIA